MKIIKLLIFTVMAFSFDACTHHTSSSDADGSIDASKDDNGEMIYSIKDARDGKIYRVVEVGGQWWMAENLNYEYKMLIDGDSVSASFCYNDIDSNCDKYGRLYTWSAAMGLNSLDYNNKLLSDSLEYRENFQGICPDGWALPDSGDWVTLQNFIFIMENDSATGYYLKTKSWKTGGLDKYGFNALPAGRGDAEGLKKIEIDTIFVNDTTVRYDTTDVIYNSVGKISYVEQGRRALFWTSSEYSAISAAAWVLDNPVQSPLHGNDNGYLGWDKDMARSIRCVRNSY